MNTFRNKNCPLCHSQEIVFRGRIPYDDPVTFSSQTIILHEAPELWRCRTCRSAFVQNIVPEELAADLYVRGNSGNKWSQASIEESKGIEIIRPLEDLFHHGVSVLDIGANTGQLLDFAQARGCKTSGVELCDASRARLREKGHEAYPTLDAVQGRFDILCAFDMIEHVYDLPAFMRSCLNRLNDSGFFLILTGNIMSLSARLTKSQWWYLRYPEHIIFPSKKYFMKYSGLTLESWIDTYASNAYKHPFRQACNLALIRYRAGRYYGLPSLGPDHVLAILRK